MTLKNKDGSVYKLRSPNAIMRDQKVWNGYIVHNMRWNPTMRVGDDATPPPVDLPARDSFVGELESSKPDKLENLPVVPKGEPAKEDERREETVGGLGVETVFVWCLPAVLKKKKDFLYNEEYDEVSYGKPYSFEAVIVEESDLSFVMWTTTVMDRGSVVFPRTTFKRWWRVTEIREKTGGFLYGGIPSDYQPHFDVG